MKLKNVIFILFFLYFFSCSAFSAENKNLREMFQNNEAVIYEINVRTFNADDKNGNGIIDFSLGETSGSFLNAIERLDEIKELGINTLHLMPITPVGKMKAMGNAGSLYSLADFRSFNLQLADAQSDLSVKEQAKKFIEECHKRGINVIIDLPSCGAYDLFIDRPDLFITGKDGEPFIPADWLDVRLFNVPADSSIYKSDIMFLHKMFINNIISIDADGVRADVATIKPYIFWKELISYAREKKPDFLFLAEASESWTKPASDKAYFTDYKKLLDAGFDGYYGNYFELKNWKTMDKLENAVKSKEKILKRYKEKKSVIGSFATHDEVSPLIIGGESYAKIIIWLNATLPLNPYYVDGFLQGDDYFYEYANKLADESYTDDEFYYVHNGQIDIFNFSRKPSGDTSMFIEEQKKAMELRNKYKDVITKGAFKALNTNNPRVFAFQRIYNKKSVAVIINRNLINSEDVSVKVKNVNRKTNITYFKNDNSVKMLKSNIRAKLKPGEIIILTLE